MVWNRLDTCVSMPACSVTADSQRSSPWPACGGQGRNAGAVSPWPQPASPGCSWRLHRTAGCWWGHGTATGNCWRGRKGGREEGQVAQSRSEEQPRQGRKAGKQKRNPACRQVQARVDARMHVHPPTQRVDGNAGCKVQVLAAVRVVHPGPLAVHKHQLGAGVGLQNIPAARRGGAG